MALFWHGHFATGEEKSILTLPTGYGYKYHPTDKWLLNYMLHNLTPDPKQVWITYDIDLIPDTAVPSATSTPTMSTSWCGLGSFRRRTCALSTFRRQSREPAKTTADLRGNDVRDVREGG